MLSDSYLRIPLDQITIDRDDRQRREFTVDDLIPSIRTRGVMNPVIVESIGPDAYRLIAGERRLTACIQLQLENIPARLAETLSPIERSIIELEENVKRQDLDWRDQTLAIARIHSLYTQLTPNWQQAQTGEAIGFSPGLMTMYLQVAEALDKKNPQVMAATGMRPAYNMIARKNNRAIDDAMNDLLTVRPRDAAVVVGTVSDNLRVSTYNPLEKDPKTGTTVVGDKGPITPAPPTTILNLNFLEFAPTYTGSPFNFVHCDFPYGLNLDKSAMQNSGGHGGGLGYDDSPDTYWELCECLARNLDRIMAPSSHLMFWFSMEYYNETIEFFKENAPSLEFQKFPLIWHKTDNRGILPDPNRGPRRIYETALIAARGDRQIVKPVGNAYGSPTTREIHQSEKSEPMLKHFFTMFIDEHSRVFDPTAGSGSAIRAAEALGARTTLGLELDPDFCTHANTALRKARILRQATA